MTPPSPAREGAPPPPRGNRCRSPSRQTATSRSSRPTADSSWARGSSAPRSEEHTSELQSRLHLACRLPPEKQMPCGRLHRAVYLYRVVLSPPRDPGEPDVRSIRTSNLTIKSIFVDTWLVPYRFSLDILCYL